jgi:O-antigen/teichoic acid export membrane protein
VYQKLTLLLALIRITPFDMQTEQGRSKERYRKALLSILANVLSRALSLVLTLLSISLTLPYLGVERFGIWMTVASFAGLLTFLDLGVGNALTNHVADRSAKGNQDLLRQAITGGLGLLAVIGFGVGFMLWLVATYLPWGSILKVEQTNLLAEARLAAMWFAVLFGVSVFTSGVQNVFAGLQKAYVGHLISGFSSLVACFILWYATSEEQGIAILLAIIMGAPMLAGLMLFTLLAAQKKFSFHDIKRMAELESKHLFKAGSLFFLLQIGTMVGWGMDSLLISSTLGVAQVAVFSVVQRLFMFATQPLAIINAPLWAAYADAHSRNEVTFIRETLKKSLIITLIFSFLAIVTLIIFQSSIIKNLTKSNVAAPISFVFTYGLWVVVQNCGNAFSMFLNGVNVIKPQVVAVLTFIAIVFPMKIYLMQDYHLSGLMSATIISYIIGPIFLYSIIYRKEIISKF